MLADEHVPLLHSKLSLHNRLVGYVFLLDEEGKIRWQAHSEPAQSELQAMVSCTNELVLEVKNMKEPVPTAPEISDVI